MKLIEDLGAKVKKSVEQNTMSNEHFCNIGQDHSLT